MTVSGQMQEPLIRLSGVTKYYKRGAEKVEVLENLDLDVPKGDFLALMAPSGKGKSTLLSLIGGIDRPSAGEVTVDGKSLKKMRDSALAAWRSRNIGFVFQLYHLMPALTAAQNVELPLLLMKMSAAERRKRTLAALAVTDMDDRANFRPAELSGGQQQRVAIARALVNEPQILLADEPTGNLDSKSEKEVMGIFHELHKAGLTVILVTHNQEIAQHAERTVRIRDGIIQEGAA